MLSSNDYRKNLHSCQSYTQFNQDFMYKFKTIIFYITCNHLGVIRKITSLLTSGRWRLKRLRKTSLFGQVAGIERY